MADSAWDRLGDNLRAHDRWGDFADAQAHPKAKEWPQIGDHPVNLLVNGCVSFDHFDAYAPILLRALDELAADSDTVGTDMVVRALTRKGLTIAVDRLLKIFTDAACIEDHRLLWAVGNAIYTISPRNHMAACIKICRNRKLGYSRQRLIVHLSRFKNSEEAFQTLIGLLEDESVRGAALEALKRFGDVRAIPAIDKTPVRGGEEGIYETYQKKMALKKLNEKKSKLMG